MAWNVALLAGLCSAAALHCESRPRSVSACCRGLTSLRMLAKRSQAREVQSKAALAPSQSAPAVQPVVVVPEAEVTYPTGALPEDWDPIFPVEAQLWEQHRVLGEPPTYDQVLAALTSTAE